MKKKILMEVTGSVKIGYINKFSTYLTGDIQMSNDIFDTKKDAEKEAEILRHCGHTNVRTLKVVYKCI